MKHRYKFNFKKFNRNILAPIGALAILIAFFGAIYIGMDYASIAYEKELDAKLESQMEYMYE